MQLAEGGIKAEARQVFDNITAIAQAAELSLAHCTRLTIYMVDLDGFDVVNQVMSEYFEEPFPARACVGVAALPKGALIEVESLFCRA